MTDEQAKVFEALSRGRLIFPYQNELDALQDQDGPLTSDESSRLSALEGLYAKVKVKDEWFHSAMLAGDIDGAGRVAQEALALMESA